MEHFTQKALVAEEARRLGLPLIEVQLGMYSSNFQFFFKAEKDPQNPKKVIYKLPVDSKTTLPFVDPEDTGPVVAKILEHPEAYIGKVIPIYGEMSTLPRAAQALSEGKSMLLIDNDSSFILFTTLPLGNHHFPYIYLVAAL